MSVRSLCLLRGVNVGGRNALPMARLREIFEELGCREVRSYIQSGNVVFTSTAREAARIPARVRERLVDELGLDVPVLLRSAAEVRAALERHPFADRGIEEKLLHIAFLAEEPSRARREALDLPCDAGEEYALLGRELHLAYPGGAGRSKLTSAVIDRALGTTSTARNVRTVRKLVGMLAVP